MRRTMGLVCAIIFCTAVQAWSQAAGTATGGAIWGKLTDQTGGILPGVTVTVAGPALMGTQEAVTNAEGVYRFPSLPPGEFTLTFSLAGFKTLVREGIRVMLAFTVTVDAELGVSAVRESIEVVAASPMVDSVNTRAQTAFSKEVLASVPLARDMWSILGAAPSIWMDRIDVGASTAGAQTGYRGYGQTQQNRPVVEGVLAIDTQGGTSYFDYGAFDEVSIGAAAQGAEMANPGTQSVFISKSGGNDFHVDFYGDYEGRALQGSNIDADQIARGIRPDASNIERYTDINLSGGGYVLRDKLWWFGSYRYRKSVVRLPNFPPDEYPTIMPFYTGKLTAQLPKRNQVVFFAMANIKKLPYRQRSHLLGTTNAIFNDPDSTWRGYNPAWLGKLEWNKIFSNNLFVEARVGHWADDWHQYGYGENWHYEDLTTRVVSGSQNNWYRYYSRPQATGAITYFKDGWAGSHNFKLGWELMKDSGVEYWYDGYYGNVVHVLRNGVPSEVYQMLAPLKRENYLWWDGVYLSDTWTTGRLSLNLGARWDHYRFFYPDQSRPANAWAPAMQVTGVDNLLTWNVLGPRFGLAWDVRGDGKTVVKTSYGRYYHNQSRTIPMIVNPNDAPQWRRYFWQDTNGDLVYQPGEERQLLGTRGGVAAGSLSRDLEAPYADEATAFVEREVAGHFGLRAGFVVKRNARLTETIDELNPYGAFNIPVSVVDPGPDGVLGTVDDGGAMTFYNLDPSLVGQNRNLVISPDDWVATYKTWELVATRRLTDRWSLNASYAVTWRDDFNGYRTNPNLPPKSDSLPITMVKISGTYDAGWGIRVAPLVRYQTGTPMARTFTARLNYGNQTVLAEEMGAIRSDDALVFDVRVERRVTLPRQTTLGLFFDLFNITNSNAATSIVTTSGSAFMRPSVILPPRVVRLGVKYSF